MSTPNSYCGINPPPKTEIDRLKERVEQLEARLGVKPAKPAYQVPPDYPLGRWDPGYGVWRSRWNNKP